MGAAAYGGRGFKERAGVSCERPIGAASYRQQHNLPTPPPVGGLMAVINIVFLR